MNALAQVLAPEEIDIVIRLDLSDGWPSSFQRAVELVVEMEDGETKELLASVLALAALRCQDDERFFREWQPQGRGS